MTKILNTLTVSGTTTMAAASATSLTLGTDLAVTEGGTGQSTAYAAQDALSVHGADIASSGTINLETATGNIVDVTGVTTITAITLSDGHERTVRFTGALTLTHGASLVLPGSVNITTVAGDMAIFRGYASSVVRCVLYSPITVTGTGAGVRATSPALITPTIDGNAVLSTTITSAAQGDILARTATTFVNVNIGTNQVVGRVAGEVVGIATTGTGNVVQATGPTLSAPILGTPASGTLTNCTGLPLGGGGTGQTTGYAANDALSIHGADVASATTTDLDSATGYLVDVTGTTNITGITLSDGRQRIVRFTGILTLTHGSSLILPGAASITTAAGDFAIFVGYAAGVVRCVSYSPLGVIAPTRLGTGASISTKYLRGDSTWQTLAGGGDALTTNPLSQFAATTSLQLGGVISDDTGDGGGTGLLVFNNGPTLIAPVLGAATATTVNKVTITQPTSGATLTIPDGVTLTGPASSGTVCTTDTIQAITSGKTFGTAGGSVSKLKIAGATSGTISLDTQPVAGTGQILLPTGPATIASLDGAETLTNKTLTAPILGTPTSGTLTNCTGLPVAGGGTGVGTLTAYAPIFGGTTTTNPVQSGTVGTSGQVLTSNGAGALPTFQTPAALTYGQALALVRGLATIY
jgi:hypothetical protein